MSFEHKRNFKFEQKGEDTRKVSTGRKGSTNRVITLSRVSTTRVSSFA